MIRDKYIVVRASELEVDILNKLAKLHGLKTSEYLRNLLRNTARQAGIPTDSTIEYQSKDLTLAA